MKSEAMSGLIRLRGITWNHSRGFLPMVATAQRFSETHASVEITWDKRSLQEFADYPVERLAQTYDLIVIDHPFVGHAARYGLFLPLDEAVSGEFLSEQEQNSVGESHRSYFYQGHQWALAIDAATPVSAWRPDVLERESIPVPETWDEVLALARRGRVAFPSIPVDSLMNFYMLCCAITNDPFPAADGFVDAGVGGEALTLLRELVTLCSPEILTWNPIATYEAMASRNDLAYCPFAYSYSNYSRAHYAPNALRFGDLCRIRGSQRARTTLGGTGLAISSKCEDREIALEYAQYVASPECQRTLYVQSGGQPGHRAAWTDPDANRLTNHFFEDTLSALDRAYVRPRYPGYIQFQDGASAVVHEFLREGGDPRSAVQELRQLFEKSRME
jgi:multiple sugar transport system substrate-binding protein